MAQKKKPNPVDAFLALSAEEKEQVVAAFAPGKPRPATKPLTPVEQAQWDRAQAKRGRGRPRNGEGAEAINVTVERGLLRRADAFAEQQGLTRARLISMALENLLPAAEKLDPTVMFDLTAEVRRREAAKTAAKAKPQRRSAAG